MERIESRCAILSAVKVNAEEVLAARKRQDSGKRGIFKGVHSIGREEVLVKVWSEEKWINEQKNKNMGNNINSGGFTS